MFSYSWPGNVRELENIIEYGISFAKGQYITEEEIKERFRHHLDRGKDRPLKELVSSYEQQAIKRTLNKYGWDEEGKARSAEE